MKINGPVLIDTGLKNETQFSLSDKHSVLIFKVLEILSKVSAYDKVLCIGAILNHSIRGISDFLCSLTEI